MSEETGLRREEAAPVRMTNKDLKILDALLERTDSLPEILHLRAAPPGYEFTDEDKALLPFNLNCYQKETVYFLKFS